jgi:mersacidin/lichenicidin family type 2 lantibiotic
MSRQEIIRAWKDAEYRNSLTESQRAALPAHPAGLVELPIDVLDAAAGGMRANTVGTGLTPCTMPAVCPATTNLMVCPKGCA